MLGQFDAPRAKLLARIKALDDAGIPVYDAVRVPGAYFYMKVPRGANIAKRYARPLYGGAERMLFDPEHFGKATLHYSVDYYVPSLDGRHVAIGGAFLGARTAGRFTIRGRRGSAPTIRRMQHARRSALISTFSAAIPNVIRSSSGTARIRPSRSSPTRPHT